MSRWKLIRTPKLHGFENMRSDLELFSAFEQGQASSTLRVYSWWPQCISFGYSQKVEAEIDLEKATALGWEIVKRPTGGGIVFHDTAEVAYSLVTEIDNPLLPAGLIPAYKKLSKAIIRALKTLGLEAEIKKLSAESSKQKAILCFSYPAQYEVVVGGKKIVGSAQKRGKRTLLQQGSIYVRNIEPPIWSLLKKPVREYNAVSVEELLGREVSYHELSEALTKGFEAELGITFNE